MKYIYMIGFNLIAVYVLAIFVFNEGGIVDNLRKSEKIAFMKDQIRKNNLELEDMKLELKRLETINSPDASILAQSGKKMNNTLIFKFYDKQLIQPALPIFDSDTSDFIKFRIYLIVVAIVILMLAANAVILISMRA